MEHRRFVDVKLSAAQLKTLAQGGNDVYIEDVIDDGQGAVFVHDYECRYEEGSGVWLEPSGEYNHG